MNFEKVYTRDTTIIIQESWGRACRKYIYDAFGWDNPYKPAVLHYIHQGVIEIWENVAATEWLKNRILDENKKRPKFYYTVVDTWMKQLEEISKYSEKRYLGTKDELAGFVRKVDDAMIGFLIYYYTAVDDRTPEPIKLNARTLREKETFFASSSTLIRNTLLHLYHFLRGYETAVLSSEVLQPPSKSVLMKRHEHFLIIDGIEYRDVTLENYLLSIGAHLKQDNIDADTAIIYGNVANRGISTGKVFTLFRREQVKRVPDGSIIVSPMTTPDFLPAMKKATAIVTDEGGITCHAAIVSRELNVPCIIGTKIATRVLKDGDLVEVDADKGVVKIIKHANVD